jgi:translation initiation factor 1A
VPKRKEVKKAEEEYLRVRLPDEREGELFGIAEQLLGGSRLKVVCADGKSRMCRIPGKLRKRLWIREGDLVVIKPWTWQDEKADIVWRYTRTEASNLSRRGLLPKSVDVF